MIRDRLKILASIMVILVTLALCGCGVDTASMAGSVSQINQSEDQTDVGEVEEPADEIELQADADLEEPQEEQVEEDANVRTYVLNTNTHKFHFPDCNSVKQMKDKNKQIEETTRDDLISRGYDPCGNCHP